MTDSANPQGPGSGPLDKPERHAGDPIGGDAYPGGGGLTPPTGDMDDPIPETGMPGEPEAIPAADPRDEGMNR
ncbi:MAG: hypothetical protein ABIO99_09815 [Candidatus Limnocylindria bacterium]